MQTLCLRGGVVPLPVRHRSARVGLDRPCHLRTTCLPLQPQGRNGTARNVKVSASSDSLDDSLLAPKQPGQQHFSGLPALWRNATKVLALLPLLGAAMLNPTATHATSWGDNAEPPVVAELAPEIPVEARDHQYPVWQREQWWRGSDDGEMEMRTVIAIAAGSTLALVLAIRFFAVISRGSGKEASPGVSKSSADGTEGGSGSGDSSLSGSNVGSPNGRDGADVGVSAATASMGAATLLAGGVDRGAGAGGQPRLGPQTSGGSIGGGGISRVGPTGSVAAPPQPKVAFRGTDTERAPGPIRTDTDKQVSGSPVRPAGADMSQQGKQQPSSEKGKDISADPKPRALNDPLLPGGSLQERHTAQWQQPTSAPAEVGDVGAIPFQFASYDPNFHADRQTRPTSQLGQPSGINEGNTAKLYWKTDSTVDGGFVKAWRLEKDGLEEDALEEDILEEDILEEDDLEEDALEEDARGEAALEEHVLKEDDLEEDALEEDDLEESALGEVDLGEVDLGENGLDDYDGDGMMLYDTAYSSEEEEADINALAAEIAAASPAFDSIPDSQDTMPLASMGSMEEPIDDVGQFASGTGRIRARPAAEEVPYNVGTGRIRARPSPTADDGPSSAAYDSGTGRIKAQPSSPAESGPSNTAYDSGTGRIRARPSAASAGEGSGHISARPDRPAERAYSRPSNGAAMSMLRLALGFVGAAIGAFDDRTDRKKTGAKRGSVAASRMLSVAREGQSLVVSSRPASPTLARSDGRRGGRRLTFAERAERSVRQQPRPLAGLVQSELPPFQGFQSPQPRWAHMQKYDLFHEALQASAADNPDAQYDPVRAVLAAVPPSGVQKYDMVGNLLRGTLEGDAAEPRSGGVRSKYDIVWQLLEAGRRSGATAKPKFDPLYDLMRTVAFVVDWGQSASDSMADWGINKYDPLRSFGPISPPVVRSKYDPWQAVLAAEAPTGDSKYDMVGSILAAAQAAPATPPQGGPVVGFIDFLRTVVGLDRGPVAESRYDPVPQLLRASPPRAPTGQQKYDLFGWLRRPSVGVSGTTVVGAGRLAVEAPGKYDPVAPLLGALAGPAPDAPEDPLRLFIRQVARGPTISTPADMSIRPAFVYQDSTTGSAVAVPVERLDAQTVTGSSRWPWKRGFWGQKADSSPPPAEVPASYSAVQPAASATAPASQPPSDEGNPNYDAVPDLLKLWSALAAKSARLDPLDAVSVIANRGAGTRFYVVAQSYRRLADDGALKLRHGAVWAVVKSTPGRTALPRPTPEAERAAGVLLQDAANNSAYKPVVDLLKGRSNKDVVRILCVLQDLLVVPAAAPPPQQPPSSEYAYGA